MSKVHCQGFEDNLDACSFNWAAGGECNDTEDVAMNPVECEVRQLQQLLTLTRDELTKERDALQTQLRIVTDEMSSLRRDLSTFQNTTIDVSTKLSRK